MSAKNKTYIFYNDPGHAWLRVHRAELIELGIAAAVSRCSYQKGSFVYLEEDCDAPLFIKAKESKGCHISIKDKHSNCSSKIRRYDSCVF